MLTPVGVDPKEAIWYEPTTSFPLVPRGTGLEEDEVVE